MKFCVCFRYALLSPNINNVVVLKEPFDAHLTIAHKHTRVFEFKWLLFVYVFFLAQSVDDSEFGDFLLVWCCRICIHLYNYAKYFEACVKIAIGHHGFCFFFHHVKISPASIVWVRLYILMKWRTIFFRKAIELNWRFRLLIENRLLHLFTWIHSFDFNTEKR